MRIKKIELSWFRGAGARAAIEPMGRSIAIYGANGAGKSCFVDAVEYALSEGRIRHLAHEYSGKHQEKAVLNTHRPSNCAGTVEFEFTDGAKVLITVSPSGAYTISGSGTEPFASLDCRRTVLRQDEVSEFVHSTKGQKYSVLLPLLGLGHLENAAENFRQLATAVSKQSGMKEAAATLRAAQSQFRQACDGAPSGEPTTTIRELCERYVSGNHEHDSALCALEAESAIEARLNDLTAQQRQQIAVEDLAGSDVRGAITALRAAAVDVVASAGQVAKGQLEVLKAATSFLDGCSPDGELTCPACGSNVRHEDMVSHVQGELSRLQEAISMSDIYNEKVQAFRRVAAEILKSCKSSEIERWADTCGDDRVRPLIDSAARLELPPGELSASQAEIMAETLGEAVVAAASAAAFHPPAAADLSRDQAKLTAAKGVLAAVELVMSAQKGERLAVKIRELEAQFRDDIHTQAEAVVAEITADIQRMWSTLHPGDPIENVRLQIPSESDKAIDIALQFHGKELDSPRLTLSEGYRNSLGLCVFLSMAARASGDTPIVLDDVIVSLDRGHRGMVVELLRSNFGNRQVLLFTHDRDWYADLRQQLGQGQWSFRALMPYRSPGEGIRWSDRDGTFDDARAFVEVRADVAANEARKVMDLELAIHVERLGLRLAYARGERNDKRTGHEFLLRLIADGKKQFKKQVAQGSYESYNDAVAAFERADGLLLTWANRGSHSEDVTPQEAEHLISVCSAAIDYFTCTSCTKPVSFATIAGGWQCRCGALRWK